MEDNQPLLIDRFMAESHELPKHLRATGRLRKTLDQELRTMRIDLRRANRFILDDEFTDMVTRAAHLVGKPEKLMARVEAASLPYETTWLELDLHRKMQTINEIGRLNYPLDDVPRRQGLLLQRSQTVKTAWAVTMVTEIARIGHEGAVVSPHACSYLFNCAEGVPKTIRGVMRLDDFGPSKTIAPISARLSGDVNNQLIGAPWGFFQEGSDGSPMTPALLARHGALAISSYHRHLLNVVPPEEWAGDYLFDVREHVGTLRWIATLLAVLNEVPMTTERVVPTGYQRIAGVKRQYMDYHRLSLKLPKTRPLQFIERRLSPGSRHRAHEVLQHWRTYTGHIEKPCRPGEHGWVYDHEHGYRLCGTCEAFGRLIPEHVRGDPSLGWVRKEYVLEKAEGASS